MEAVMTFPFVPLFPSLLFSSLHLFFGSRPGTNVVGTGFYHLPMEMRFPVRQIHGKVAIEPYRSVVGHISS